MCCRYCQARWGQGGLCLNPPIARPFCSLRVEPPNLSPPAPGRAFLSTVPSLPRSARTCRVVFCRVVSCLWPVSVSSLLSCSLVRSVPCNCTATNQTAAVPFPPFPPPSDSLPSPHKSRPIDFSPAAASQPSPAQPLEAQPAQPAHRPAQPARRQAQPSSRQPSSPSLPLLPQQPERRSRGHSQGQGQLRAPQDLEGTDIQRGKE